MGIFRRERFRKGKIIVVSGLKFKYEAFFGLMFLGRGRWGFR